MFQTCFLGIPEAHHKSMESHLIHVSSIISTYVPENLPPLGKASLTTIHCALYLCVEKKKHEQRLDWRKRTWLRLIYVTSHTMQFFGIMPLLIISLFRMITYGYWPCYPYSRIVLSFVPSSRVFYASGFVSNRAGPSGNHVTPCEADLNFDFGGCHLQGVSCPSFVSENRRKQLDNTET